MNRYRNPGLLYYLVLASGKKTVWKQKSTVWTQLRWATTTTKAKCAGTDCLGDFLLGTQREEMWAAVLMGTRVIFIKGNFLPSPWFYRKHHCLGLGAGGGVTSAVSWAGRGISLFFFFPLMKHCLDWWQLSSNLHSSLCMKDFPQVVKIFRAVLYNHVSPLIIFDPFFTNEDVKWQE